MRIYVRVVARAGRNEVCEIAQNEFRVRTTCVPERGRANESVIAQLAKHFKIAKSRVSIVGGASARTKIVDIL